MRASSVVVAVLFIVSCGSSSGSHGSADSGGATHEGGGGTSSEAGASRGEAGAKREAGTSQGEAGAKREAGTSRGEAGTPPPSVDASGVQAPPAICTAPIAAADVSHPTTVVGTGTAASCTESALSAALTAGGVVTFNCGSAPATITVTATIELPYDKDTVVDGGGKVTIDGGGAVRILDWDSPNYRATMFSLTLQNIMFAHGHATGTMPYAPAPAPCSTGYYDGAGGALQMRDGVLRVINATFVDNQAEKLGPDVGGGAIYLNGGLDGVVVGSTFINNSASNSGAIGSLNSDLDVYNSSFQGNAALGFGANSNDESMCSVMATNGQYQVGSGGNAGAVGMDGGSDGTHTFCGDTFEKNSGGAQAVGGAMGRTPDQAQQTTVLDRCVFEGNTGDGGGAAYFHNSTLTITASTFSSNVGQGVGAIQADGTVFDFTNVTFYDNQSATSVGATLALFNATGAAGGTLLNCTFADNVCEATNMFAAAIFGSPDLTIQNTIFDDNTAQNPGAPMQCQVGTTTGTGDLQWPVDHTNGGAADALCVPGIYEGGDPDLGTLGDNGGPVPTMIPSSSSPAQGRGTGCPATDARGKPRSASSCTAGAVEGSS
jgi:hypothetical protein